MSGKKEVVDLFIGDIERAWLVGWNERQRHAISATSRLRLDDDLDAADDQFSNRRPFARRAALQSPIDCVRNVDCRAHHSLWHIYGMRAIGPASRAKAD